MTFWRAQDGQRAMRARIVNCNYFQMIENSVDQNHLKWLHRTAKTPTWDDGEINPQVFEHGVLNTYIRSVAGKRWAHVNFFVMPTMNKTGNVEEGHPTEHRASSSCEVMRWRVPIDDTRTIHYTVEFGATRRRPDDCENHEGSFRARACRKPCRENTAGTTRSAGLPAKTRIARHRKAKGRSSTGLRSIW